MLPPANLLHHACLTLNTSHSTQVSLTTFWTLLHHQWPWLTMVNAQHFLCHLSPQSLPPPQPAMCTPIAHPATWFWLILYSGIFHHLYRLSAHSLASSTRASSFVGTQLCSLLQEHTGHLPTWGVHLSVSSLFCLFILFMGLSRQECWNGLPLPSPVGLSRQECWNGLPLPSPVLTGTFCQNSPPRPICLGWPYRAWLIVSVELQKAVVHAISLISFLWMWFSVLSTPRGIRVRGLWKLPDSILKSRDITLQTKVRLVKAIVFPVVMYGCESWTIKKAEHQRIDVFFFFLIYFH